MKILLVGVGGVGEAIAVIAQDRPWLETMVLSDINLDRANEVRGRLRHPDRFPVERVDATDRGLIVELARKYDVDLVMNAVEPLFNEPIFDAAFEVGCDVHGHGDDPVDARTRPIRYRLPGIKLGDYQFERSDALGGERVARARRDGRRARPGRRVRRVTRRSTCSTGSTRSASATARTSRSAATSSRRTSRSGPRSRNASTRPSI